ncbi:MAG TPA: hypothetical protein VFR31_14185 [Thermoanaerobaculia bacterium]|nr:hypothetical protein [Thermoanaerobaculia bacterium]
MQKRKKAREQGDRKIDPVSLCDELERVEQSFRQAQVLLRAAQQGSGRPETISRKLRRRSHSFQLATPEVELRLYSRRETNT